MDKYDGDNHAEEDDESNSNNLDPRIGQKLEELNKWTGNINDLEKRFEEANNKFRVILSESTDRLKALSSKLGKSVDDSRPYYEAKEKLKEVQAKCQRAAINYEKACQAYLEAKERINLAEKKFASAASEFDTTWQEMLNQANIKLMQAESMKKESERLHHNWMKDFHSAEMTVINLERKLKGAIQRSKVYFDEKKRFQKQLCSVKEEIEIIIREINCSKSRYAATLKELECISEEIHEKRNCSLLKHLKREPGVGAELRTDLAQVDACFIGTIDSRLAKIDVKDPETSSSCQTDEEEPSFLSQASSSDALSVLSITISHGTTNSDAAADYIGTSERELTSLIDDNQFNGVIEKSDDFGPICSSHFDDQSFKTEDSKENNIDNCSNDGDNDTKKNTKTDNKFVEIAFD